MPVVNTTFITPQAKGIMEIWQRAANPAQKSGVIDNALGSGQTPMTKVTGINYAAELPKVDMQAMKPDATNRISNLPGVRAQAQTTRDQVAKVAGNFTQEVKAVQGAMDTAMEQACENLGMDYKQAQTSIKPAPTSTATDAAFSTGMDATLSLGMLGPVIQAVNEIRQERGQLSAEQEARLFDEMQALLTPQRDMNGNVVAPPAIKSDYDFEGINLAEMKELYKPRAMQVEGQAIFAMLHELDHEVLPNLDYAEDHKHDNTGNKLAAALDEGDTATVEAIVKDDVEAVEFVAEIQDESLLTAGTVLLQANSLRDASMTTPETPELNPEVIAAMSDYRKEFKLQPTLETSIGFNSAA